MHRLVIGIWHDRAEDGAVPSHPGCQRRYEFLLGPRTDAGFVVRRQIASVGKEGIIFIFSEREAPSGEKAVEIEMSVVQAAWRMTVCAVGEMTRNVFSVLGRDSARRG